MSELRNSRPAQTMAGDAVAAVAKPAKVAKPAVSAAKVISKAAKARPVESRKTAKGIVLRCMVGTGAKQCHNPARHPHGKAFTCSTHDRAIAAGRKVNLGGKATLPYIAPHAVASAS